MNSPRLNYSRFNDDFDVLYRENDELGLPQLTIEHVFELVQEGLVLDITEMEASGGGKYPLYQVLFGQPVVINQDINGKIPDFHENFEVHIQKLRKNMVIFYA